MITSRANPQVKHVRRLLSDRRYRHEHGAFVVEGVRWLGELAVAGLVPLAVYATPAWLADPANAARLAALGVMPEPVEEHVLAAMSDTETAPGVLAVVPLRPRPFPDAPRFLLILDAIATPGNLGSILRAGAAAGVEGVWLGPGCVDPYNPKVVRGSMGALLRLPVRQAEWPVIADAVRGLDVWLAAAAGGTPYTQVDWRRPAALLIGSESAGAGREAAALATGRVTIPMRDATESLNAAVAAGILLFEAARGRHDGERSRA